MEEEEAGYGNGLTQSEVILPAGHAHCLTLELGAVYRHNVKESFIDWRGNRRENILCVVLIHHLSIKKKKKPNKLMLYRKG